MPQNRQPSQQQCIHVQQLSTQQQQQCYEAELDVNWQRWCMLAAWERGDLHKPVRDTQQMFRSICVHVHHSHTYSRLSQQCILSQTIKPTNYLACQIVPKPPRTPVWMPTFVCVPVSVSHPSADLVKGAQLKAFFSTMCQGLTTICMHA